MFSALIAVLTVINLQPDYRLEPCSWRERWGPHGPLGLHRGWCESCGGTATLGARVTGRSVIVGR